MKNNLIAVLAGVLVGFVVNAALIMVGTSIIPVPEGIDSSSADALRNSAYLLEAKHFIFPLLAHALGTLVGALLAAKLAVDSKMRCAMIVGIVFLMGGISTAYMVNGPMWFSITDLLLAYIPMAWIGGKAGS